MTVPKSLRFVTKRHSRKPYLKLHVTNSDDSNFDFTSATGVTFLMYDADGVEVVNAAGSVVSPATAGILQYAWAAVDVQTEGEFTAEFDVDFSGEKMTLPLNGTIEVKIYEDLNNG
jgi:hypothetical protein